MLGATLDATSTFVTLAGARTSCSRDSRRECRYELRDIFLFTVGCAKNRRPRRSASSNIREPLRSPIHERAPRSCSEATHRALPCRPRHVHGACVIVDDHWLANNLADHRATRRGMRQSVRGRPMKRASPIRRDDEARRALARSHPYDRKICERDQLQLDDRSLDMA